MLSYWLVSFGMVASIQFDSQSEATTGGLIVSRYRACSMQSHGLPIGSVISTFATRPLAHEIGATRAQRLSASSSDHDDDVAGAKGDPAQPRKRSENPSRPGAAPVDVLT